MLSKIIASFKPKNLYHENHNKFKVALLGIKIVFKEETSFRYQIVLMFITIGFGLFLGLSKLEWMAIIFATTIVFTFEMVNTAIENIIDMVSPDYHELAGKVKDISAGAVLISSLGALIIGALIFVPKIIDLF